MTDQVTEMTAQRDRLETQLDKTQEEMGQLISDQKIRIQSLVNDKEMDESHHKNSVTALKQKLETSNRELQSL